MVKHENDTERLILKALTGPQSGVEVALADGEYSLGSGQDDDLQFVDVCLKSGHARIRIENQKVSIAGGAGTLTNEAGTVIDAGDEDWRAIKPLETITIGSSVFAFGPASADWSGVSEKLSGRRREDGKVVWNIPRFGLKDISLKKTAAASVIGLLVVCLGWLVAGPITGHGNYLASSASRSLEKLQDAVNDLPFASAIQLSQEVDGSIYVSGYLTQPVERRALQNAISDAGVPVNSRVWVLSSIKTQIEAAIESFGVGVAYNLSPKGVAAFQGTILSKENAERFFHYIRNEVKGISEVENHVKTAESLFEEVAELAKRSGVDETVLFHLLDERIEASGVVVRDKLDAWVGFLQSYARRHADDIPLTSYVQLVNDQGVVVAEAAPTRLGNDKLPATEGMIDLDMARLKEGTVQGSDLFKDLKPDSENSGPPSPQDDELVSAKNETLSEDAMSLEELGIPLERLSGTDGDLAGDIRKILDKTGADGNGDASGRPTDPQNQRDKVAKTIMNHWEDAAIGMPSSADGENQREEIRDRYLSLVLTPGTGVDSCWHASKLRVSDIPAVLFWLDYLSLSKNVSLVDFPQDSQHLLLEAALNPLRTRRCAAQVGRDVGLSFDKMSLYLDEIDRNPAFVRYLVRDYLAPSINVAGVMLGHGNRFIQMPDGTKVSEGSSTDVESKLISVGALGALLRKDSAFSPVVYSDSLNWKVQH